MPKSTRKPRFFRHSIFLRIYVGSVLICLFVGGLTYLLLVGIARERAQNYRENLASSAFGMAADHLAHLDENERALWLRDASDIFGEPLTLVPLNALELSRQARASLANDRSFVQEFDTGLRVFHQIPNEEKALAVDIYQVGERQLRAVVAFLLEDLRKYPDFKAQKSRLSKLSARSKFNLRFVPFGDIVLTKDQKLRLEQDGMTILYTEKFSQSVPSLQILVLSDFDDMVISIGPIEFFNQMPTNIALFVLILALLMISLGIYALIFPLERGLAQLQRGVASVGKGDFNRPVAVMGNDEISYLSASFNQMTGHIQRLIGTQRELVRAVSHELRTPVARIRFGVQMMADTDDYDSRLTQLNAIDGDIDALNALIDEILTYAKLEQDRPSLTWERVDLSELVAQITQESMALAKNITIHSEGAGVALADRLYLHRVLQNFVGNALRHAKSCIWISAGVRGGMAFVRVEDDGDGIAPHDRDKVFLPFARLDDSRTRASGGYGLGLSIVSRIAFWFGGRASVEDAVHLNGACFVMRWQEAPAHAKNQEKK